MMTNEWGELFCRSLLADYGTCQCGRSYLNHFFMILGLLSKQILVDSGQGTLFSTMAEKRKPVFSFTTSNSLRLSRSRGPDHVVTVFPSALVSKEADLNFWFSFDCGNSINIPTLHGYTAPHCGYQRYPRCYSLHWSKWTLAYGTWHSSEKAVRQKVYHLSTSENTYPLSSGGKRHCCLDHQGSKATIEQRGDDKTTPIYLLHGGERKDNDP